LLRASRVLAKPALILSKKPIRELLSVANAEFKMNNESFPSILHSAF
jgi:hypothetical protein